MRLNSKGARAIIEGYEPHKGFFDLSKKPESLGIMEYAKILKLQNFLADQSKHSDYLRKYNPTQWEKLQELSGELQQIILYHWGNSVFC